MNYISINNQKAIEHFKKLGCSLVLIKRPDTVTRLAWEDDDFLKEPVYKHFYEVTGGSLPKMGGQKFHQYLVDHRLLMSQQD